MAYSSSSVEDFSVGPSRKKSRFARAFTKIAAVLGHGPSRATLLIERDVKLEAAHMADIRHATNQIIEAEALQDRASARVAAANLSRSERLLRELSARKHLVQQRIDKVQNAESTLEHVRVTHQLVRAQLKSLGNPAEVRREMDEAAKEVVRLNNAMGKIDEAMDDELLVSQSEASRDRVAAFQSSAHDSDLDAIISRVVGRAPSGGGAQSLGARSTQPAELGRV
jgi:hypothetical protein